MDGTEKRKKFSAERSIAARTIIIYTTPSSLACLHARAIEMATNNSRIPPEVQEKIRELEEELNEGKWISYLSIYQSPWCAVVLNFAAWGGRQLRVFSN